MIRTSMYWSPTASYILKHLISTLMHVYNSLVWEMVNNWQTIIGLSS